MSWPCTNKAHGKHISKNRTVTKYGTHNTMVSVYHLTGKLALHNKSITIQMVKEKHDWMTGKTHITYLATYL